MDNYTKSFTDLNSILNSFNDIIKYDFAPSHDNYDNVNFLGQFSIPTTAFSNVYTQSVLYPQLDNTVHINGTDYNESAYTKRQRDILQDPTIYLNDSNSKIFSEGLTGDELNAFLKGESLKDYQEFSNKFFNNADKALKYAVNSFNSKNLTLNDYTKTRIIKELYKNGIKPEDIANIPDFSSESVKRALGFSTSKALDGRPATEYATTTEFNYSENPYVNAVFKRIGGNKNKAISEDLDNVSSINNQVEKSVLGALKDIGKNESDLKNLPDGALESIVYNSLAPDSWYEFIDELGNDTNIKIDENRLRSELKQTLEFFSKNSTTSKIFDSVISTQAKAYIYKKQLNDLNNLRSKLSTEMQVLARQGYSNTKEYKSLERQLADATNMFIDTMNTANKDLYLAETAKGVYDNYINAIQANTSIANTPFVNQQVLQYIKNGKFNDALNIQKESYSSKYNKNVELLKNLTKSIESIENNFNYKK